MKNITLSVVLAGLFTVNTYAGEKAHWTYAGEHGPEHWADLSAEFEACGKGKNQSPIDLTGMVEGKLPKIDVDYKAGAKAVVNNGHTIKVDYAPGSTITVDNHTYELKQFHFHSPSENTIKGESFPMEAHFVHADEAGNLAVIALMYEQGKQNAELEKAWMKMPNEAGHSKALSEELDASALLPKKYDYFRFNGSLTTPPCTEGVKWMVMKQHSSASKAQLDKFVAAMDNQANNRPVQPLNARMVIQ